MRTPDFSIKGKRIFIIIPVVALCFLTAAFIVGMWSAEDIKETVLKQFNDEQLVIAQHISFLIEREIALLTREMTHLDNTLSSLMHDTKAFQTAILSTFSRVVNSGVQKIELIDANRGISRICLPEQEKTRAPIPDDTFLKINPLDLKSIKTIRLSPLDIKPSAIRMHILSPLKNHAGSFIAFHVDVYALLSSFLQSVKSGKTGYAWIIDENGYFLYHPMKDFVGRDAFKIRDEKDPTISYGIINFIQKEKMMAGLSGTDYYLSGWHRGETGLTKKLIAYQAINVYAPEKRKWSVAVVAPISEIEKDVKSACSKQTAMQSLIIIGIIIVGSVTIIFERRLSELLKKEIDQRTEDVKKSEMKYRSLVESAEDFIFTVDLKGYLQSLNSFTARFFGGELADFTGKPIETLFPPKTAQKQRNIIRSIRECGKSIKDEFEVKIQDKRYWISANFMPLKDKAGDVNAILCIARDITESKNLEIQLVNAEKLASLGTMAAGVAHEINNPLGVILGFSDILLRKTEKNSQTYEDLKTIERQGLHCKEIVENLLSFVRIGKGQSEFTNLNDCIEEILKIVKHTLELNRIELRMDLAQAIPQVKCGHRQLQQVILNIINNAIAAMEGGGKLTIKTEFDAIRQKGVIHISDSGHGIREEDLEHIYDPFFTTKSEGKGTGLGLFVSYGIITKYDGSIDCKSHTADSNQILPGTTFIIKLPVKAKESSCAAKS
jgi:PAS domain S-box-containing protein